MHTIVDDIGTAHQLTSRGYNEAGPGDSSPARLSGSQLRAEGLVAGARLRSVLEASPGLLSLAETARRLGVSHDALVTSLASLTYVLSDLYENDRGALGLLGVHDG